MANDHYAAYLALVAHSNPYDTISYSRYPAELADAIRAADAAHQRTLHERDLLDEACDQMSFLCQAKQYDCIDFQRTILTAQKRALAAAEQAEQAALATVDRVRREL